MIAAALRADTADFDVFLDVTASKLEDALPEHTTVTRGRWFGHRRGRAREVEVRIGEEVFKLTRQGHGVQATVSHVVHGVTLATTNVPVDAWLGRLAAALAKYADGQARGREALERLLR